MRLVFEFTPEWQTYLDAHPTRVYLEAWIPGGQRVFCFDLNGTPRWPYEKCGLDLIPPVRPPIPADGETLIFRDTIVASFQNFKGEICLRLYLHHHDEPHHVGDTLVDVNAKFKSAIYSHGDVGWLKVPIYAYASIEHKPQNPDDAYFVPNNSLDVLAHVFEKTIWPDRKFLTQNAHAMHPSLKKIVRVLTYSSVPTLPVFTRVEGVFDDIEMNRVFAQVSGAPGCANWSPRRGNGVRPATSEWLQKRVLETLMLSGLHTKKNWVDNGFVWDDSGTIEDQYKRQFIEIVDKCLLGDDPIKPLGHQKGRLVLHAWAKQVMDAVILALGSHAATRRYVYDHREYLSEGKLKTNWNTDEFTLAFGLPGDCEDGNSTVYFLTIWILNMFWGDPFLRAIQACLAIAGMPCCAAGTSRNPSETVDNTCTAGHLFGFAIPHRIFAQMVWGAPEADVFLELNAYLKLHVGRGTSLFVFRAVQPHVVETIARTSAEYVDRDVEKQDNDLERFQVYLNVMERRGLDAVLPKLIMATYPLALPHGDEHVGIKHRHGFLVHGHIIRLFAGAIPTLFRSEFRARHGSLAINDSAGRDPRLHRTIAFIPRHASGSYSMPSEHLHLCPEQYRLVSMTRISSDVQESVDILTRRERPFVSLDVVDWPAPPIMLSYPPCEFAKDQFILYLFGDRINATSLSIVRELLAEYKQESVTVRQWAWCVALILNFV